jgi:hypothetical protein
LLIFGGDAAKRDDGDFSPGELERIAPPVPQLKVTYDYLVWQWLLDADG